MKKQQLCAYAGLLLSCVMVLLAAGCGGGASPHPVPTGAITVSITPPVAAVGIGQTTQFSVTTNDPSGVNWTASAGTIDASGNYTAPADTQGPQQP